MNKVLVIIVTGLFLCLDLSSSAFCASSGGRGGGGQPSGEWHGGAHYVGEGHRGYHGGGGHRGPDGGYYGGWMKVVPTPPQPGKEGAAQ